MLYRYVLLKFRKQRGNHKRRYVGKLSSDEFISNDNYMWSLQSEGVVAVKTVPKASKNSNSKFHGATYRQATSWAYCPRFCQQIESLCYYCILKNGHFLYRLHKWGLTHVHPFENDLPSPGTSELLGKKILGI